MTQYAKMAKIALVMLLLTALVMPSTVLASTSTTVVKLWVGNNIMSIGGVRQPIDSEGTKPVIVEGRTLVPIRAVIEAFDGSVAWDAATRKVTVSLGDNALNLWIGKSTASLNGTTLPIDAANPHVIPVIMSGRTMLPLRFVSESLGIDVQYEATTKMITLTYTIDTTPPPLSAPILLSPADGTKFANELPKLSWLPASGADASRVQILSSGAEVHAKSNLTSADYVVPAGVLTDGTYTWRVSVHNEGGWGPWSAARSLVFASVALPAAPSLLTPTDQSSVGASAVTLTWTSVPDASAYRVRILHGMDQTHAAADIATTSYGVPSGVLVVGSYSWQVCAYVGGIWSDWSSSWLFTVEATALSAPRLLTPADQSVLDSAGVVLTWASVADADSYRIQVLRDGTEVHAASGLASTVYSVPSGVLASGRYSWQAAAHGSAGWSAWSGAYSFEARAKLTTSDIAKYVDRIVLIEVNGFEDGKAFSASGSGFFISSDGKIVTNHHVIDAATEGTVTLNGKQKYDIASVLGYDKDQDLAVIRISGTGFPICTLGDSSKVGVGDPVVAIGSPLGIQNTVSEGIVSKLWEDGSLQITAPISPGSSGGALFNMYGEVIGVTTWKIRNGENMNLAVPVNLLQNLDTTLNLTLAQVFQKEYPGAAVLPAPSPLSPASEAVVSTLTPTLSWTVVPGATRYNVKVFLAPNGRPFLVDETVTGTSYTIPSGVLLSGVRYTWTVFAGNSLGWSANLTMPGSIYDPSFTVQAPVTLTPPSLLEPEADYEVWPDLESYKVSFRWASVAGATSYVVWIGSGPTGDNSTKLYSYETSSTSYTISTSILTEGRLYTWAVAACNASSVKWSTDRHFSIVDGNGVSTLYPINYSTISTNPTMMWYPYGGADSYFVALYQGTNYNTATKILFNPVYTTQYTLPGYTLTRGLPYLWCIYATSNGLLIATSAYAYFNVSP